MQDIQGTYVWQSSFTSNPSNSTPYQLKLKNNGELILMDNKANIVWSSLYNPICIIFSLIYLLVWV